MDKVKARANRTLNLRSLNFRRVEHALRWSIISDTMRPRCLMKTATISSILWGYEKKKDCIISLLEFENAESTVASAYISEINPMYILHSCTLSKCQRVKKCQGGNVS